MTQRLNYVIVGLINQHQIWFKSRDISDDANPPEQEGRDAQVRIRGSSTGAIYGLGLIGASIFFIREASTIEQKALGFGKSLVWPAILVYRLFEFLSRK